jgi:hypothetical protein
MTAAALATDEPALAKRELENELLRRRISTLEQAAKDHAYVVNKHEREHPEWREQTIALQDKLSASQDKVHALQRKLPVAS